MTGPAGIRSGGGLRDRAFTAAEARAVAAWSYEPPFDLYELSGDDAVVLLTARDADGLGYYPVEVGGEVAGFVCFGPEGRVAGQEPEPGTVDVGAGLHPDRVSQGLATALMPEVVRFATERLGAARVRAAVAAFNERSIRLCTSAGFRPVRKFPGPGGRPFVELVRELRS
jgi:ribosomal-protein-alanine N-acetyltransferase